MKIHTVNEYRIEVELADAEARALGVSYETLDWAHTDTRRALWSLLGKVRAQGAALTLSGRLLIEAACVPEGLRLSFTALPPRGGANALSLVKEASPVLRCGSYAALLLAAQALKPAALTAYRRGETWYLLAEEPCDPLAFSRAAEFGEPVCARTELRPALEEYCSRVPL